LKNTRTENTGISALRSREVLCVTDKDKAEALNHQFKSVFTDEKSELPHKGPPICPSIPDLHIGMEGVQKQLSSLKTRKATGPDEIPARFLHDFAPGIAPMVTHLFQQSFDTGTTPNDWKSATVTAIFKKGAKSDPANYRPISLACILKVMEHIVVSHL
jgi:hypothetical protein